MTNETTNRNQRSYERSQRSRKRRRRSAKDLDKDEDDARKHDSELDRQGKRKRQRQPSSSPERQRNMLMGICEEQGNRQEKLSYRCSSSASSETPRILLNSVDVAKRKKDSRRDKDRRRSKQSQHSKRRSVRSDSFHDDSTGHYHIRKGAIIGHRYKIVKEAGLGTFGRVVECLQISDRNEDRGHRSSREPDRHVAIKIVRNVKRYYESAVIEARIISEANRLGGRGRTHCVLLLDTFRIDGHFCLVFENLGPSLYDFLKRTNYQPFPMLCVQDFTVQLLETLEFLHGIRMIHTDLKIENVLLMNDREVTYRNQRVPASTKIKIIDFGGACYDSDKKSAVINTRQYRAPEVILGTGWSMPSDMWSLGCILAELYSGELLFATHDDVEHLALIEKKIGLFPRRMINASKDGQDPELARSAFDSTGLHRLGRVLTSEHYSFVRKALPLESHIKSDDDWFLDLLRRILVIDPHERATAHEALQYLRRIRRDVVRCT